jgi:tetratricopeptide (TPR) repeat protein
MSRTRFIRTLVIATSKALSILLIAFIFCNFNLDIATASPEDSATNRLRFGIEKLRIGDYSEAIAQLTQVIDINQKSVVAYSNRCLAYLQLQDYQNAITDCNQAINLAPDNIEAYINRGIAYYRQGNYQAATEDNNFVIARKPHDFRAYYNRGVVNSARGSYGDAISDYYRALSLVPETPSYLSADIYNDLGLAKFHFRNFEDATSNFTLAIRLNPQDYRAYFNRGCTCGKNGDNFGAVRDFSDTVRLNPSNAQAYINRGIAYHRLGYEQAALADLHTGASHFGQQGQQIAYQKTLDLIKAVQSQIPAMEQTG